MMNTTAHRDNRSDDKELLAVIGVQSSAHARYITECTFELERLRQGQDLIMDRKLHEQVRTVGDVISLIIENCKADPHDIREEIGLASELRILVQGIFDYSELKLSGASKTRDGATTVEKIVQNLNSALPRYQNLLERMKNNDAEDPLNRAKLTSRILDLKPE